MRCMSCGADIPPIWVKALQRNECPNCGDAIMGEPTQALLKELTEAMEKMPNNPQGVAGWLLSNYRFQKMGSGQPVEFNSKGRGNGQGYFDESGLKVDPSYNEFIRRNNAGNLVAKGEQLSRLKHGGGKLAEFASIIQGGVPDPYGDGPNMGMPNMQMPMQGMQNMQNQQNMQMQKYASMQMQQPQNYGGGFDSGFGGGFGMGGGAPDMSDQKAYTELMASGIDPFANNTVGGITDMSQAIAPQEIMNLMSQGQNAPLKEEVMLMQSAEGRAHLQRQEFKRLKAQDAIAGAGNGVFRR